MKRAGDLEGDGIPGLEKKSQEGFVPDDVKSAEGDSKATVKTQVRRWVSVRVREGGGEGEGRLGGRGLCLMMSSQLRETARQQYKHR